MTRFVFRLTLVMFLLFPAAAARGQRPAGVAPPTLSPYFGLFNRNTGVLPNYHEYVRPQQQLRAALAQQSAAIRSVEREVSRLGAPASAVRSTGTGSVFMNYSHYYPSLSGHGGAAVGGSRGFSRPAHQGSSWPALGGGRLGLGR